MYVKTHGILFKNPPLYDKTCFACKCKFAFMKNDILVDVLDNEYYVRCPECGTVLKIEEKVAEKILNV